jgi:BlaI family penicillinase repressor
MGAESPTELELLILKVLWDQSPLTASQIRELLESRGRSLAHTSVITVLQRMVAKKQLQQLDPVEGKAFRFEPLITDQQVTRGMLGEFVDRVFDGSAEAVMLSLFDASELDEDAIKRLRKAFNQKLKEKSHE